MSAPERAQLKLEEELGRIEAAYERGDMQAFGRNQTALLQNIAALKAQQLALAEKQFSISLNSDSATLNASGSILGPELTNLCQQLVDVNRDIVRGSLPVDDSKVSEPAPRKKSPSAYKLESLSSSDSESDSDVL